jgi:hypothetical protein
VSNFIQLVQPHRIGISRGVAIAALAFVPVSERLAARGAPEVLIANLRHLVIAEAAELKPARAREELLVSGVQGLRGVAAHKLTHLKANFETRRKNFETRKSFQDQGLMKRRKFWKKL